MGSTNAVIEAPAAYSRLQVPRLAGPRNGRACSPTTARTP